MFFAQVFLAFQSHHLSTLLEESDAIVCNLSLLSYFIFHHPSVGTLLYVSPFSHCGCLAVGAVLHEVRPYSGGNLCRGYSTAIFTLSLPIFATTIVPCCAENETLPSIDFAEPRVLPSVALKFNLVSKRQLKHGVV